MLQWMGSAEPHDQVLAFNLFADFLEHLKGQSVALWDDPMQKLLDGSSGILSKEAEVRVAAGFALNLAFRVPEFTKTYKNGQAAQVAFGMLAQVIANSPKPKNKDTNAKLAYDNAVAASVMACIHAPQLDGVNDDFWAKIFTKLPLKFDEDESQKLNEYLFDLCEKNGSTPESQAALGAQGQRLGKFLALFGDVYSTELITDELKDRIKASIGGMMEGGALAKFAGDWNAKQKKKIEKIVKAGRNSSPSIHARAMQQSGYAGR